MKDKLLYNTVVDPEAEPTIAPKETQLFESAPSLEWNKGIREENTGAGERRARILINHDESCFKSGEMCAKRWIYGDQRPFCSKGRGRSIMYSEFIVQFNGMKIFRKFGNYRGGKITLNDVY